ncbi:RNA chaperone Hfq [Sulfurihydrogenibium azorense]|uniref:RNA-binding protein Hfq n=1 Tax=Sulfurihydrogenibium azorense (strain DSM 15241 / OCM 825 / Az-Fu1) TaxID=204536 RepID=C1DWW9_SULAA|nr:RNA chaperone Hfq [Sulfurihydrogenibium azorense]ACN99133.1 RNA chaperone Hfq [Sulfurihydrogenibium azorense Az-Fu1]MDM7273872.1 RNA chaperone Hfq [Sulfurihydrogenibium azorense]
MAKQKDNRLQEKFLNTIRKEKVRCDVYLVNGVKLEGKIKYFDNFTILLKEGPRQVLVYKHAITTVAPKKEIEFEFEQEEPQDQE